MVSSLGGPLGDADEADPFLADGDESQRPGFAAHEEPVAPYGRVCGAEADGPPGAVIPPPPKLTSTITIGIRVTEPTLTGSANDRLHMKILAQALGQGIGHSPAG